MNKSQNESLTFSQGEDTTSYSHSLARPNQNVRDSSIEAFDDYSRSDNYQNEALQCAAALRAIGPASRRMLSEATGQPINHITQNVKRLIESGSAIELAEKRPCAISSRKVYFIQIAPKQGELFS